MCEETLESKLWGPGSGVVIGGSGLRYQMLCGVLSKEGTLQCIVSTIFEFGGLSAWSSTLEAMKLKGTWCKEKHFLGWQSHTLSLRTEGKKPGER